MRLKVVNVCILRKQMDKKRQRSESDDSVGSLVEFIAPEEVVADEVKIPVADEDIVEILKQEAEQFTKNITATIVNGRTLRSRDPKDLEKRKPRDLYYERFGKAEEERLMEKFTKKDIIEFLKKLEPEHKVAYESCNGNVWPSLNTKLSLEKITSEYKKVKVFLELPDSDDESETEDDDEEEFEESTVEEIEASDEESEDSPESEDASDEEEDSDDETMESTEEEDSDESEEE